MRPKTVVFVESAISNKVSPARALYLTQPKGRGHGVIKLPGVPEGVGVAEGVSVGEGLGV